MVCSKMELTLKTYKNDGKNLSIMSEKMPNKFIAREKPTVKDKWKKRNKSHRRKQKRMDLATLVISARYEITGRTSGVRSDWRGQKWTKNRQIIYEKVKENINTLQRLHS